MTSSLSSRFLITSGSSGFGAGQGDRFAHQEWEPRSPRARASLEATKLDRVSRLLLDFVKARPRILLVDAALLLHELHLTLLRSIPAIVVRLTSCGEMYLHNEHGYALVILVFPPKSRETAEAADYVRHRWRTARILLLECESAMIDDWLYDARIDPHFHPATVREAAIRLMAGQEYWVPA